MYRKIKILLIKIIIINKLDRFNILQAGGNTKMLKTPESTFNIGNKSSDFAFNVGKTWEKVILTWANDI